MSFRPRRRWRAIGAAESAILVAETRADGGVLAARAQSAGHATTSRDTLLRALALALVADDRHDSGDRRLVRAARVAPARGVHDAIARIMQGDLASRLPVSREGDEIDRIAGRSI